MKLSCLPVSLFGDIVSGKIEMLDWARAAKEMGYDGFDISMMFLKNRTQSYIEDLRAGLRSVGLPIIMSAAYSDFTHPDELQREREFAYLQNDIALCSELGIPYLRLLAGQEHVEVPLETRLDWVDSYFHKIDAWAEKMGVRLVFENHGKAGAWNYATDITFTPSNFLRICQRVRDTAIRVNFDGGNLTAFGADPMDVLPEVMDLVETVHVSDMKRPGEFSPTVIGTGATPIRQIFHCLKAHGFDGWVCIEEASGGGLEGIRQAYHTVKGLWAEA